MTLLNIEIKQTEHSGRTHCPQRRAYYVTLREKQSYEKGKTNNLRGTSLTLDRMLSY